MYDDLKRLGTAQAVAQEYGCHPTTVKLKLREKKQLSQSKIGKKQTAPRTDDERYVFSLLISTMIRIGDNVKIAPPDMVIDYAIEDVRKKLCGIDVRATVIYNKEKRLKPLSKRSFMR